MGNSIFDANSKNVFEGFSQSNRNQLGNLTRDKEDKRMKIFKDMFLATKDDCHNLYTLVAFARKILVSPLLISNAKMPHKSRTTKTHLDGRVLRTTNEETNAYF